MTEQPTTPPLCDRPGCLYAAIAGTTRCLPHAEPGTSGSYAGRYSGPYRAPTDYPEPVTVPARPYTSPEVAKEEVPQVKQPPTPSLGEAGSSLGAPGGPLSNRVPLGDLVPALRRLDDPPTPDELRRIADDLNSHGGLDETFVAELLRHAADPYADAKRGLGIADPPVTKTEPTKPITYESIVEALEKIAPLSAPQEPIKLTPEQMAIVRRNAPAPDPFAPDPTLWSVPVEIVETVEESTPYRLWLEQAEAEHGMKVVAELPGGAILGNPAWLIGDRPPVAITGREWPPGMPRPLLLNDADLTDTEYAVLRARWEHVHGGAEQKHHAFLVAAPEPAPRPWWRRALDRVRRWGR